MARLLLFAAAREAAGVRDDVVDASTVGEALKVAVERYGDGFARVLSVCTVLAGDQTVPADRAWEVAVSGDTEIAVLPPVSGGADDSVRMVDVSAKEETPRLAVAECRLVTTPLVRSRLLSGRVAKGDAVAAAQVAGMFAAKRVPELIPMCHPVRLGAVDVSCEAMGEDAVLVRARVRGVDRTGFEMEALTAAAVAALTLYDMGKSEDPSMRIEGLRLLEKSGGKSGRWSAK